MGTDKPSAASRPLAVILLQIVLVLAALQLLILAGLGQLMYFRALARMPSGVSLSVLQLSLAQALGALTQPVFPLFVLWLLIKRNPWGRWLGLLSIFVLWLVLFYVALLTPHSPLPNVAQEGGALIARVVLVAVAFPFWAYRFAFSRRARAFFQSGE